MLKKIVACLSAALIIFMSVITASADGSTTSTGSSGAEHGGSSGKFGDDSTISINSWTWRSFDKYLHDYDLTDHVFDNLKDLSYKMSNLSSSSCVARFDKKYLSGASFLSHSSFYVFDSDISYKPSTSYDYACGIYSSCHNFYTYSPFGDSVTTKSCNGALQSYLSISYGGHYDDNYCYIVSDIDVYRSLVSKFPNFSEQIFYCANPLNSFLKYIDSGNYDFNPIVPPDGFNKTAIKFYAWDDSPKGEYQLDYYDINLENYAKCGLFADVPTYYSSTFNNDKSVNFMHKENITFYVDVTDVLRDIDEFNSAFNYSDSEIENFLNKDNRMSRITDYFNKHFRAVHYEKSNYSWRDFFNDTRRSNTFKFKCYIDSSYHNKVYATFDIKSYYSYLEDVGSSKTGMLTGYRVVHTSSRIDATSGELGKNKDGLGSDISQADDTVSRPPTRQELADMGFENGYPNTEGDFPYTLTIYRNGTEYFKMYFSKKPSVSSDFYSSQCIKYGFNVDDMKIYMYFKEQNMSKLFDFTDDTVRDRNTTDNLFDYGGITIVDPIDVLSDQGIKIFQNLLNVDTSEFCNTYTLYAWTNYTGKFPDHYNGFYCKFNWDLENSGHFQKNNSDDDYDYSKDFKKDDGKKDNNGNIHGGAVEKPTEVSTNGFNNTDFSFDDNTLWGYSNQFLVFCARCFTVLPAWIWLLIASGIAIIIVLRILGR